MNCSPDEENGFLLDMNETLIFQMHRVHSVMFRVANALMQEASVPVKVEQLPVLMCIFNYGKLSQQEVANLIERDKSSVQRTVTALERKGLIDISQDIKDKRKNILQTTETGTFVVRQIEDILKRVEEHIFAAFHAEDRGNTVSIIRETADKLELMNI